MGDIPFIVGWVMKRIDQVSTWAKKRGRRNAIQSMEKSVADNDNTAINKRLHDLKQKAKNKRDSE